jgi:hypothetical protein
MSRRTPERNVRVIMAGGHSEDIPARKCDATHVYALSGVTSRMSNSSTARQFSGSRLLEMLPLQQVATGTSLRSRILNKQLAERGEDR